MNTFNKEYTFFSEFNSSMPDHGGRKQKMMDGWNPSMLKCLIREQLKELHCVLPLKMVMKTSSPKSAVALLPVLSAHCTHDTMITYTAAS